MTAFKVANPNPSPSPSPNPNPNPNPKGEEAQTKSLELKDAAVQAWGEAERRLAQHVAKVRIGVS